LQSTSLRRFGLTGAGEAASAVAGPNSMAMAAATAHVHARDTCIASSRQSGRPG